MENPACQLCTVEIAWSNFVACDGPKGCRLLRGGRQKLQEIKPAQVLGATRCNQLFRWSDGRSVCLRYCAVTLVYRGLRAMKRTRWPGLEQDETPRSGQLADALHHHGATSVIPMSASATMRSSASLTRSRLGNTC